MLENYNGIKSLFDKKELSEKEEEVIKDAFYPDEIYKNEKDKIRLAWLFYPSNIFYDIDKLKEFILKKVVNKADSTQALYKDSKGNIKTESELEKEILEKNPSINNYKDENKKKALDLQKKVKAKQEGLKAIDKPQKTQGDSNASLRENPQSPSPVIAREQSDRSNPQFKEIAHNPTLDLKENTKQADSSIKDSTSEAIKENITKESSENLESTKQKTIKAVDNYAKTAEFKALSKDKQEAILSLKEIQPAEMPLNEKIENIENLIKHFNSKQDKTQREFYLKLLNDTKENADITLKIQKENTIRKEYIKAYQHKKTHDLYYIAITENDDKINITSYPITDIKDVIRQIKKAKEVLGHRGFLPAPALNQSHEAASKSITQEFKKLHSYQVKHLREELKDLLNKNEYAEMHAEEELELARSGIRDNEKLLKEAQETKAKGEKHTPRLLRIIQDLEEELKESQAFYKKVEEGKAEVHMFAPKHPSRLEKIIKEYKKITADDEIERLEKEVVKYKYRESEALKELDNIPNYKQEFKEFENNIPQGLIYFKMEFPRRVELIRSPEYYPLSEVVEDIFAALKDYEIREATKENLEKMLIDKMAVSQEQAKRVAEAFIKVKNNKTKTKSLKVIKRILKEDTNTTLQANPHISSGILSGSVAGIESDEEGNISINPQAFLAGLIGGSVGSKGISKGWKILQDNPQIKQKVAESLADTLAKGWEKAAQQYPILKTLEPMYIMQNEKGRVAQSKAMLNKLEKAEKKGLINVVYNDKKEVYIKRDLENIDYLAKLQSGYETNKKGKGGKHIQLKHTLDSTQEGYVTPQEVAEMGVKMREFLGNNEPFIETDKQGRQAINYEWENDKGVRFRIVTTNKNLTSRATTAPHLQDVNEIITFYSDRNAKNKMKFKNKDLEAIIM